MGGHLLFPFKRKQKDIYVSPRISLKNGSGKEL